MQTETAWTAKLDRAVDAHLEQMVQVRRHLHANPETSGHEKQTTCYLDKQFREKGFEIRHGPDGCGLIVDPPSEWTNGAARRIALRADIDALSVQDAKTVPYHSVVPGVMHACGHDGHTATVLGATLALAATTRAGLLPWPVSWRTIFQPAEETNLGALGMVEAGALDGTAALLALHMDPSRPVGEIGLKAGIFTAECDEMLIEVKGRGGHASRPHESVDPIATAAHLISSIYLFVPRAIDAHEPVVVTIGQIDGGAHYNVIPDRVRMRGTLRSLGGEVRQQTMDHIRQLALGLAEASGSAIQVKYLPGPPALHNDPDLTDMIHNCAADLLGPQHVHSIERPSMGGEDFAHYLNWVPGSMFRLGCATGQVAAPLHSPEFDIDERALGIGAKILLRAAVAWSRPIQ